MNADDKIRAILHAQAETVDPSPAGWDAIQEGITVRGARTWWLRGSALAGAAAMVVAAAVYVAADRSQQAIEGVPTTPGPSAPAVSVSPEPAVPPAAAPEPLGAIWPLTTRAELRAWQDDNTTYPSLRSARGAALAFARTYLGLPDATIEGADKYGVSTLRVRNGSFLVTTVTVTGFGPDGTAPFVVTNAQSESLRILSPAAGARLTGPVHASGTVEGVDPVIDVYVRADGDGSAPSASELKTRADHGPEGWSTRVKVGFTRPTGSLLVTSPSGKDGSVAAAAAIPVTFGTVPGPATFVAAREGRIALVSSATGDVVRWLTRPVPGAGAHDPELSEDGKSVVYAQAAGTCAAEIRSVPLAGGGPTTLVRGEGRVRHPSRHGDVLAYISTACDAGGAEEEIVVRVRGRVVERIPVRATAGPDVGSDGVVSYAFLPDGGGPRYALYFPEDDATSVTDGPDGCVIGGIASHGPVVYFAASCPVAGGAGRVAVYRADNGRLVATLDMPAPSSLDVAGDALLLGTDAHSGQAAYAYVDGELRRVPGLAQRPTWSFLGPAGGS